MSTLTMTSCTATEVLHWHNELRARLKELNERKLAANEAGQLDAWLFEYDQATAALEELEQHYPHLSY